MFKRTLFLAALGVFAGPTVPAHAGGKNVAIIDDSRGQPPSHGQYWCQFLTNHGYSCTLFPQEGPTGPLDPFDVVIDLSFYWSDPTGMLADFMRAGKTVITAHDAPLALGVDTNPTVQAWIGANASAGGDGRLRTTASDPILGNIPVGTVLGDCAGIGCTALNDTSGHPGAKVLARYDYGAGPIGIMRNVWEGGVSVFVGGFHDEIVLNAMQARSLTIPTVTSWGLLALALGLGVAGTLVIRRHRALTPSRSTLPALFIVCLLVASAAVRADVT